MRKIPILHIVESPETLYVTLNDGEVYSIPVEKLLAFASKIEGDTLPQPSPVVIRIHRE